MGVYKGFDKMKPQLCLSSKKNSSYIGNFEDPKLHIF